MGAPTKKPRGGWPEAPPPLTRYVFYPRMSALVRVILQKCYARELNRDMCEGSEKRVALQLLWDGWIEVAPEDPNLSDLRLTSSGLEWLAKDLARKK